MRRLVWALLGILATALGLTLVGSLVLRGRLNHDAAVRQAAVNRQLVQHHEAFIADQGFATTLGVFAARPGGDAGLFLNPRLRWNTSDVLETAFAAQHPGIELLSIPAPLAQLLGAEWVEARAADLSGADLAWLSTLPQYGYWDLEANSPVALMPTYDALTAPLPSFVELLRWAKLRLVSGLKDGALDAAVRETRALAYLCYSTETLIGAMVGVAILGYEEELRQPAERLGLAGSEALLSKEATGRLRRALFASGAYAQRELPLAYADVFPHMQVGQCAALHEALLPEVFVLRPLLRESQPEAYARLDQLLAGTASTCRLTNLRRVWKDDRQIRARVDSRAYWCEVAASAGEGTDTDDDCLLGWTVGLLPGARSLVAELLANIVRADYFRYYEEETSP